MSVSNSHSLARDANFEEYSLEVIPNVYKHSEWQLEYKNSVTNTEDLLKRLAISSEKLSISSKAQLQFPIRVPESYVRRMQKSNPNDPLLLQVLPSVHEDKITPGFTNDPVGDLESIKTPGLLQKYNGRALVLATSLCAIHCRYCFRRHFPYSEQNARQNNWDQALQQLQKSTNISEVILSGGDPLMLDDTILAKFIKELELIPHIKRLRIHTRLPVVIPKRVENGLLSWLSTTRLQVIMVTHINHAQEINEDLKVSLLKLKRAKCTLLNQSVLLKNINDSASDIITLSEALFSAEVLPYYLHLLDKVEGAAHFEVDKQEASALMREVSKHLPGYLVPKLAQEQAGKHSKTLVFY